MGLEPTTAAMARRYSSQLSYTRKIKIENIWILYIFSENQVFILEFMVFVYNAPTLSMRRHFRTSLCYHS